MVGSSSNTSNQDSSRDSHSKLIEKSMAKAFLNLIKRLAASRRLNVFGIVVQKENGAANQNG